MTINRSHLEQLPQEIANQVVAANLNKTEIDSLRCSSKTMHTLFAPISDVAKLLEFVKKANYVEANRMIACDPTLMFKYVSHKKMDGDYEKVSPLKYAFKVLDTYMWKMFLEKIIGCKKLHILKDFPKNLEKYKDNHLLVLGKIYSVGIDGEIELATMQHPKLVSCFMQQLDEQRDNITLEPLFQAYKAFADQFNLWSQDRITRQEIDQVYLEVGKLQREHLPLHMLKEFCRNGNSWDPASKFEVTETERPKGILVYNISSGRDESVLQLVSNSSLQNFILIRGDRWVPCASYGLFKNAGVFWETSSAPVHDSETFKRLYAIRNDDIATMRLQLNLLSDFQHKI